MKLFLFITILLSGAIFANAQAENAVPEADKPKAGSFRKPPEDAQKSNTPLFGQIDLTNDDGCGNPLAETQAYSFRNGRVIVVTDDNKLIVKVARGSGGGKVRSEKYENPDDVKRLQQPQLLTVSLVGIDVTHNPSAIKRFLLDNVLDRDVSVLGNTRKDGDKSLDALVNITSGDARGEVSQLLLENGIARFREFQLTNLVPRRTACQLEKAEARAKQEKLGIWAK